MKKILLTLSIACALTGMVQARSLVITTTDGSKIYYLITKESYPVMTFTNGQIVINSDAYEFSGINKFRISNTDDPTGLESIAEGGRKFSLSDNTLYISGATKADVYNVDGMKMDVTTRLTGDMLAVDLTGLRKGVYMVKAGTCTIKFTKK